VFDKSKTIALGQVKQMDSWPSHLRNTYRDSVTGRNVRQGYRVYSLNANFTHSGKSKTPLPIPLEYAGQPQDFENLSRGHVFQWPESQIFLTKSVSLNEDSPAENPKPLQRWSFENDMPPNWDRELLYPKEGRKRVPIVKEDIERLDSERFLNDNLINFYLLYLELELQHTRSPLSEEVYFFSTYFYKSLTRGGTDSIDYSAVSGWTKRVPLFKYKYIIIPINDEVHRHWYLAIICNCDELGGKFNPDKHEMDVEQ
jgi:Ulp1 protease family, C-terminal catalytic domain